VGNRQTNHGAYANRSDGIARAFDGSRVRRRGHSLLETVVSLSVYGLLATGMTSVIAISGHTLNLAHGPTAQVSDAARLSERIARDLRLAQRFTEVTASSLAFTVPDRDSDWRPETIRYAWLGAPDYQVTQHVQLSGSSNTGSPVVIASDVREFSFDYLLRTWGRPAPLPEMESDEVLLMSHDDRPEESGYRVLFVTRDNGLLTSQETARRNLLQSQGFVVELIAATANQSTTDSALTRNDVVYISQQVRATDVGSKLSNPMIGVVNEKAELVDELGLATSGGSSSDQQVIEFTSATHYIPAPLLPGHFSLLTTGQPVIWLNDAAAQQAPDLRVLGRWPTAASLAVLEAGAERWTASSTAGVLGNQTIYANQTAYGEVTNLHVATQVTLPSDARLASITAYVTLSTTRPLRFGLYSDRVGEPGSLVAQTSSVNQATGSGWRTISFSSPVLVQAGTYWLATSMAAESRYWYESNTGKVRHANSGTNPADGLMSSWSGTVANNTRRPSIYANYETTSISDGRRVQLPWGADGFDFQSSSDQARALTCRGVAWAADRTPGNSSQPFSLTSTTQAAQYFRPSLPANATNWKTTRVMVSLKADTAASSGAALTFQLRESDAAYKPAGRTLQSSAAIPVASWSSTKWTWFQLPWNPESDLDPGTGVCLVLRASHDKAAAVSLDQGGVPATAGTHFLKSLDSGTSWSSPDSVQDLRFYVYGTYTTSGAPQW